MAQTVAGEAEAVGARGGAGAGEVVFPYSGQHSKLHNEEERECEKTNNVPNVPKGTADAAVEQNAAELNAGEKAAEQKAADAVQKAVEKKEEEKRQQERAARAT